MNAVIGAAVLAVLAVAAAATSPYKGEHARPVKALSEEQIADYLAGRGMGLARAAELNHYPGPRHVLDLAPRLGLSADQIEQTRRIFERMRTRAMALGEQVVAEERELERQFASATVSEGSLEASVSRIARLQGELRRVHLAAHIAQRAVLTEAQVHHYDALRGYTGGAQGQRHHRHRHRH